MKNQIKPELVKLKNGLEVILVPMKETRTVTVSIATRAGGNFETKFNNGISHFVEHMLFKGTKDKKNCKVISVLMDGLGGNYNASTSKDRTYYYAKVASSRLKEAVDFVADIYQNSLFRSGDINKERGAIIEEINMYEDNPSSKVYNVFQELLFGNNQSAGWKVLGSKKNVSGITKKTLVDYWKDNYTVENSLLVLAGNFDRKKALNLLNKNFGSLPKGERKYENKFKGYGSKRVSIFNKKTDQTNLIIGCPSINIFDERRQTLHLLNDILGAGASSRLFLNIREKLGLAYSIYAYYGLYDNYGSFQIAGGIKTEKTERAIKEIVKELKKIASKNVDKKELEKVKSMRKSGLLLGLETSNSWASFFANKYFDWGRFWTVSEVLKEIDSVQPSDIKKLAQEFLKPENLRLAIVGPFKKKDEERFLKLLK